MLQWCRPAAGALRLRRGIVRAGPPARRGPPGPPCGGPAGGLPPRAGEGFTVGGRAARPCYGPAGGDGDAAARGQTRVGGAALCAGCDRGAGAPLPPDVVGRGDQGNGAILAVELPGGIRLDGQLDGNVYFTVPAITDFIPQAPDEGPPATEEAEAWILFDADNVYVAARIWDSAAPSQ